MADKIKKLCEELVDKFITEFKDDNNMNKVKKDVLDPCVQYILKKIYPYILATCIIFTLILLMTMAILVILIFNKKYNLINNKIG